MIYKQIHELENQLGALEEDILTLEQQPSEAAGELAGRQTNPYLDDMIVEDNGTDDTAPDAGSDSGMSGKVAEPVQEVPEVAGGNGADAMYVSEMPDHVPADRMASEEAGESADSGWEGKSVMDIYAGREAWRTGMPGSELKDIMSAISLNDRALFINTLFREDPELFVNTIRDLNSMHSLDQAVEYIRVRFPEWDMDSELVYRFMMEVRRKLR